ncbi:hypothetical protein TorRG33x02_353650, partial [Trema orientale]
KNVSKSSETESAVRDSGLWRNNLSPVGLNLGVLINFVAEEGAVKRIIIGSSR